MLYIVAPWDLRKRYECEWLQFTRMVLEETFTKDDVVVLTEYAIEDRVDMLDALNKVRNQGARVVYVGSDANESDEWKRQLTILGVYDFYFAGSELNLKMIDDLLENPRSPKDVAEYLLEMLGRVTTELPTVVDEYEENSDEVTEQVAATTEQAANEAPGNILEKVMQFGEGIRFKRKTDAEPLPMPTLPPKTQKKTRLVWKNPEPVLVQVLGDSGVGKSFVSWNLAALCNHRELPSAIVDTDVEGLKRWIDPVTGVHVYEEIPKNGYRVHFTSNRTSKDADLVLAVTFPDPYRIERMKLRLEQLEIPDERVLWVLNAHLSDLPLIGLEATDNLAVPHDPRQLGAIRMKTPLALSDERFAEYFEPIVLRITDLFIQKAEGGSQNVVASGV